MGGSQVQDTKTPGKTVAEMIEHWALSWTGIMDAEGSRVSYGSKKSREMRAGGPESCRQSREIESRISEEVSAEVGQVWNGEKGLWLGSRGQD